MVEANTSIDEDLSLPDFLTRRAAAASKLRLAVDLAVGIAAMVVALWLRPDWWRFLVCAGLCLASFGAWAAIGRVSAKDSSPRIRAIATVRALLALAGFGSALAIGFLGWMILMGTWIS